MIKTKKHFKVKHFKVYFHSDKNLKIFFYSGASIFRINNRFVVKNDKILYLKISTLRPT